MTNYKSRVWIITGATSGTGLALAEEILERGVDKVVGTSRDKNKFQTLSINSNPNFLGLEVDIQNEDSLKDAVKRTLEKFGDIDIVVNNAGQGMLGSIEELTIDQIKNSMDTNYFGPVNVIKAFLPHLRAKKSGYIVNIASNVGISGFLGLGAYSAAKFALVGMSESLYQDVKQFGIQVSVVILGLFATGFGTVSNESQNFISEYKTKETLMDMMKEYVSQLSPGDPKKFAKLMVDQSLQENHPFHLIVGKDSISTIENKNKILQNECDSQRDKASNVGIDLPK